MVLRIQVRQENSGRRMRLLDPALPTELNLPTEFAVREVGGVNVNVGIAGADRLEQTCQVTRGDALRDDRIRVIRWQNTDVLSGNGSGDGARGRTRRLGSTAQEDDDTAVSPTGAKVNMRLHHRDYSCFHRRARRTGSYPS